MKKVAFIAQPEYFRFTYERDLDDLFEVREFPFHYSMTDEDFVDLLDFQADYNFFFRGEFFPEVTLKKIQGVKIALSSEPFPRRINNKWEYTLDSLKRYLVFRRIRDKAFNYIFHYSQSELPLFAKDGLGVSGEFYFPVALGTYKPQDVEKKWDIFFIGRSTPHRENFMLPLKHHYHFLHIAHGVWGKDLVEYINRSKICLNLHAEPEVSWEPRMQMLLACGALVLSEPITPNPFLRPGIDYLEISKPPELYQLVTDLLSNEQKRQRVIQNAKERVPQYFDTRQRFLDLIEKISRKEYPPAQKIHNGHPFINCLAKVFSL